MKIKKGDLEFLSPSWSGDNGIQAYSTLRQGGVSQNAWESMNLASHVDDDSDRVENNRSKVLAVLKCPDCYWLEQVHSTTAIKAPFQGFLPQADACWTDQPDTACVVLTADCLPLLLADAETGKVAAVHAGWRGLANGIITQTFEASNLNPNSTVAWLAPAIGSNVYEVGEDVLTAFQQSDIFGRLDYATAFTSTDENYYLCDLYALARQELMSLGVSDVSGGDQCTYSQPEDFFSYRRDGQTGRMASIIWMQC